MARGILWTFWMLLLWPSLVAGAEIVPPAPEPASYYHITIPKDGLAEFLRYHPFRVPLVSHHRGGPAPGYPENAVETMDNALRYGFGLMEVDVAALKDGTLVLMHDDTLDRTTTGKGPVKEKTWPEIQALYLRDNEGRETSFKVPSLDTALGWAVGRAILTLDIKRGTDFVEVYKAIQRVGAKDYALAITYSIEQARAFHTVAPEMLLSVSVYNDADVADLLASGIPKDRIVAWTGTRLLPADFYAKLHAQGWRTISGTFALDQQLAETGNNAAYTEILHRGVDIIATDRFWAVQGQIRNPNLFFFSRTDLPRRPN